jgi:hypothetical protein
VLFSFWREGTRIRDVTIRDFAPDHRIFQRTASHYEWGTIEGIDPRGRLKVNRADGKTFLFDVTTGKELNAEPK